MNVTLEDAWLSPEAATFFRNVMPMYLHDITAFDTDFYSLDDEGRFQPNLVDDWLAPRTPDANVREAVDEDRQPLQRTHVIVADGRRVGFACVGLAPFRYMREDSDSILCEFFIVHSHRGHGVAEAAAAQVLLLHAGRWELLVLHDNVRALRFWERVLPRVAAGPIETVRQPRDVAWLFETES